MQHIARTPFARGPVARAAVAALIRPAAPELAPLPRDGIDKWSLLADLRTARTRFGITDRDLAVLHALLTFLPGKRLTAEASLVVFPSNRALCDRAHGMAESTLRRHLAALALAGLIRRQDSPNGKRYARRDRSGALIVAYGFDLRPLLDQAAPITAAAAALAAEAEALRAAREGLTLRLRDAAALVAHGAETGAAGAWPALAARVALIRSRLRRKLDTDTLNHLAAEAEAILREAAAALADPDPAGPAETGPAVSQGATAAHFGRHQQNSDPEDTEDERHENSKATATRRAETPPLALVLKACPDILPYARHGIATWRDLHETAGSVRGMLGISPQAWGRAVAVMGPDAAAATLAAILQRADGITSPGGYLTALARKADAGAFGPGPMIRALLPLPGPRAERG